MSTLFVNNIKHTGGTSAMAIDSSGRVAQPVLPSITVEISTSGYVNVAHEAIIPFNNILFHNGGLNTSFNTSTHKLTIPIAGVWSISFHALAESSESTLDASLFLERSGSNVRQCRFFQSTNREISGSIHIPCLVSDVLTIQNNSGGTRGYIGTGGNEGNRYTWWSSTFLG